MPRGTSLTVIALAFSLSCGEGVNDTGSSAETAIDVSLNGLQPLDSAREGTYEGWIIQIDGAIVTVGRFGVGPDPTTVTLSGSFDTPDHFMITVEPPGDDDGRPSAHKLMGGRIVDGAAVLDVSGYVTLVGIPLESSPGTHILATPTDDGDRGYPSREDAGLWMFNPAVDTLDAAYYTDFAPLTEGWRYEGWIVRDYGSMNAIWISYGKFRPDPFRQANLRDDTGLGVFSGRRDYVFALGLTLHVPGDDWLSDSLGIASLPFAFPLDLNGDSMLGVPSNWTHVITVEPWGPNREAELPTEAQPFFFQPYRNAIGEAAPELPRTIEFVADNVPSGIATLVSN